MASISLQNITKRFGTTTALADISLEISSGEFFVVLGPSGAGKTTALRVIAGLEHADAGRLQLGGQDMTSATPAQRDCAFVFQQYSLYPHLSVFDNMAFPLRAPNRRMAESEVTRRVNQVAAMLRIDSKLKSKSTALSGGEMQRVAIGRALVRQPQVYLMDEPLSSLDAGLREELRVELKRIQRQSGATVVYVTHDQVEATTLADRIAILESGRVIQVDTPQTVYDQPNSLVVAQRLGSPAINVLPAEWFDTSVCPQAAYVGVRPEDVSLVPGDGPDAYQVAECSLVKHLVVGQRAGVSVRAHAMLDHDLPIGSSVQLTFAIHRRLFFSKEGHRLNPF